MTPAGWALVIFAAGVILDRVWIRMEQTATWERRLPRFGFGPPPTNCRIVGRPALFDWEADGD